MKRLALLLEFWFSWSHVTPGTLERMAYSDKHHGSRQCDGKPNSFSELFNRSSSVMDGLKKSIDESPFWNQPAADAVAHVAATAVDSEYAAARAAEGWLPEEIGPLYCPTPEQWNDPYWFTAMMLGPGKEQGSLHIRMPRKWCSTEEHAHGHVSWPKSSPLWRLEVVEPNVAVPAESEDRKVMGVRVLRPETQGMRSDSAVASQQKRIVVPTGPDEFGQFIEALPQIVPYTPVLYGPQSKMLPEQVRDLHRVMPS